MADGIDQVLSRIRQSLEQLEERLRGKEIPLPEGVPWIVVDAPGRVTELTPSAAELLGLGTDAIGQSLAECLDLDQDPTRPGLLQVRIAEQALALFAVRCGDGLCLVVGNNVDAGAGVDRQLAHDLANVLAVMRGRAEMAAMDDVPEAVRRSMEEVVAAADRAQSLLDER